MEENKKILSISVACYNLGDMIRTNIESFCKSNVAKDIELIITDDGSKDNSADIVEEYVKLYPATVKLIRKVNEGPGSTVNSGIQHATGKYFRMVDGDDWVNTENLEEYINLLKNTNADMVVSDYDIYDNTQQKIIETKTANLPILTEIQFNDYYNQIPYEMHFSAFKTSIFKDNDIKLDNCFYTDVEYLLYPIQYVKTVAYFNKTIYIYRVAQATQSVNPNSMKKNIAQHELVLNHLLELYESIKDKILLGHQKFIVDRLAKMCDVQLTTYLYFKPSKENKEKIKAFISCIKQKYNEIFQVFKKSKKYKLLKYSKYLLYPLASKLCIKKCNK